MISVQSPCIETFFICCYHHFSSFSLLLFSTRKSKLTFSRNPSHHKPHPSHPTAFTDSGLLNGKWFLSRVSTLTRDIDIAILSVRLSLRSSVRPPVCLSVTRWYCMKTAEHFVTFFHYTVAYSFQFYQHQTWSRNSDGSPPAGALITGGYKISRFSTSKSLYLANDTRYRHSYYGRRIGTHKRSIKWCHFQ